MSVVNILLSIPIEVEVEIFIESGGKKQSFLNFTNMCVHWPCPDCLCSLAQGEDCSGTPVKVQKTDSTVEPDMA